jgi:hypothetical protein
MKKILFLIVVAALVCFALYFKKPALAPTGKENLIEVTSPQPYDLVKSPLKIRGKARGVWYFEASFPVQIIDEQGNVLGQGHATALSDWMTEDFVMFDSVIDFIKPESGKGFLILKKDNPSGMPEKDDQLKIPLRF